MRTLSEDVGVWTHFQAGKLYVTGHDNNSSFDRWTHLCDTPLTGPEMVAGPCKYDALDTDSLQTNAPLCELDKTSYGQDTEEEGCQAVKDEASRPLKKTEKWAPRPGRKSVSGEISTKFKSTLYPLLISLP